MEPTPKAPKAVTKRKTPAKNASHPSGEQGTRGKKIRVSGALEVAGPAPSVYQTPRPQLAECERSSDFTNTTVVGHYQATSATITINSPTGGGEGLAETNVGEFLSRGIATATLKSRQQLPRIFGSAAGYPKIRDISTLSRTSQNPDFATGFSDADLLHLPQPDLRATRREPNVPSEANFLSIPPSNTRKPQSQATSKSTKSLLPSIRKQLEESPNTSLGTDPTVIGGKDGSGTKKITNRRFKGLKLNINRVSLIPETTSTTSGVGKTTNCENPPATTDVSTNTSSVSPVAFNILRKQDHEISSSIIRNPPRYSLRRQVEKIARILALTAFHSFFNYSVPGDFLKKFTGLSRNYRYASTLAFTHLVRIEFPGQRTERWFEAKRIDEKVADVRSWYWHRVSERKRVIERVRTSWMERVWRFLVLASKPAEPSSVADISPGRFGLWFSGVSQDLLANPDLDGQFETALRFWIRRFYVWVTKSGGGYPQLLDDLREEMVQGIQPLDEKDNQELWRLETKRGGVHFIIGMTGEVVGWVGTNGGGGNGLELVRQRRVKTRINTVIRARTTARIIGGEFSAGFSQGGGRRQGNVDDVTWKDLRGDWREHASALVSSVGPPGGTDSPPRGLLEAVYRPDSKTVSHGIHESVKLPHHRVLAERWILAQVEPGGISGKPVLDALHGQTRKKEKVTLDLQAKLTVESVRCSGEKWISSMKGVLAQGLAFVQTPGIGWFVLEETGQVGSWRLRCPSDR